jgi:hypothetical protein
MRQAHPPMSTPSSPPIVQWSTTCSIPLNGQQRDSCLQTRHGNILPPNGVCGCTLLRVNSIDCRHPCFAARMVKRRGRGAPHYQQNMQNFKTAGRGVRAWWDVSSGGRTRVVCVPRVVLAWIDSVNQSQRAGSAHEPHNAGARRFLLSGVCWRQLLAVWGVSFRHKVGRAEWTKNPWRQGNATFGAAHQPGGTTG